MRTRSSLMVKAKDGVVPYGKTPSSRRIAKHARNKKQRSNNRAAINEQL